jgi:hypothetical protein
MTAMLEVTMARLTTAHLLMVAKARLTELQETGERLRRIDAYMEMWKSDAQTDEKQRVEADARYLCNQILRG